MFGNEWKAEVCGWFSISDFEGSVVFAQYDQEYYEGYAEVVILREGKFYSINGAHCSCYGLEDQWSEVEMTPSAYRRIAEQGYGLAQSAAKEVLGFLKKHDLNEAPDDEVETRLKAIFG